MGETAGAVSPAGRLYITSSLEEWRDIGRWTSLRRCGLAEGLFGISELKFELLEVFNHIAVAPANRNGDAIYFYFFGGVRFNLVNGNDERAVNALEEVGW